MLNLVFLQTWEGLLEDSLDLPKGIQGSFLVWWQMPDYSGVNERELGLISC